MLACRRIPRLSCLMLALPTSHAHAACTLQRCFTAEIAARAYMPERN
jgi:hypothetical protein